MTLIREFAPAKINLYLHITGRRPDGYHNLDSLVAFASIGDEIALRAGQGFHFEVTGAYADVLAREPVDNNLAIKAARSLAEVVGHRVEASAVLVKNLPVASGIGGGSTDAAAMLRALARHWGLDKDDPRIMEAAARHGQDVPACVTIGNAYLTETGILATAPLPKADVVLVNPGVTLSTPEVYKVFREEGFAFTPQKRLDKVPQTVEALVSELKVRTNDLYEPACRLMPEISEVITVLEASGECLLARMSGSGATCFGIFPDEVSVKSVAAQIRAVRPRWWVETGTLNG